jgi:hypothetical protein
MSAFEVLVIGAVLGARLLVPLAIPRRPVPALVAALVLDAVDQTVLQATGTEFDDYQGYDKALDVYYLSIAYASTLRNWTPGLAFATARVLWYFRLVGVAAFEITGDRWLLLVFANTFEYFFLAYELVRTRWDPRRLSDAQVLGLAAGLWVFVKLPQEWWLHVAQRDVTDELSARPQLIPVLLLAAAALALAARRHRHRLPVADWPTTTRVDAHLPRLEIIGPADAIPLRSRTFGLQVAEKTLLVSLTVIVFAEVLPDVVATQTQIVLSCLVVIVANATVSQAFARRGSQWDTTRSQFLSMAVVNVLIVAAFRILPGPRGAFVEPEHVLFFVLLLTLQVTLYDRYRTMRRARSEVGTVRWLKAR